MVKGGGRRPSSLSADLHGGGSSSFTTAANSLSGDKEATACVGIGNDVVDARRNGDTKNLLVSSSVTHATRVSSPCLRSVAGRTADAERGADLGIRLFFELDCNGRERIITNVAELHSNPLCPQVVCGNAMESLVVNPCVVAPHLLHKVDSNVIWDGILVSPSNNNHLAHLDSAATHDNFSLNMKEVFPSLNSNVHASPAVNRTKRTLHNAQVTPTHLRVNAEQLKSVEMDDRPFQLNIANVKDKLEKLE